jgi:predicted aspartyl protease
MGLTHLTIKIQSPTDKDKTKDIKLLIDSGALYTVIPEKQLAELGIKKDSKREFILADGRTIERYMGGALFEYSNRRSFAPVIFGNATDVPVLGATALESLGFGLNPLKRSLFELQVSL